MYPRALSARRRVQVTSDSLQTDRSKAAARAGAALPQVTILLAAPRRDAGQGAFDPLARLLTSG